jgi:hypothetical protein
MGTNERVDGNPIYREQLLTLKDLIIFKAELIAEITALINARREEMPKQWLRTSEVRKMLGVSSGTLQNLRISRKVSFSKIGGIMYYKFDDVLKLLDENSVPKV